MKYNPFKPNSIVGPGIFAGRSDELDDLDQSLFQTKMGNPRHFLIHGERGIGKSSLMLVLECMATGKFPGVSSQLLYNFMTAKVEIGVTTSRGDLVRKIGREFAREVRRLNAVKSIASDVFEILKRLEVAGVKYNSVADNDQVELTEDLCDHIGDALGRLSGCTDGLLILIDEADNVCQEAHLGEFIKLFTERLTRTGVNNVLLGISGISNVIQKLQASHESAPRILTHLKLEPLLEKERKEVIRKGISEANERSSEKVEIDPDAEDWICKFSEGFPHFIQQYASSAFDTDNNWVINSNDVIHGAFKENGALDQLGVRYFNEMYSSQINSDEYRRVLQVMAESPDRYVSRRHIQGETHFKKTTLGNALQALKSRKIILAHPEKQGLYRLPSDSFALWIRMKSQREAEQDHKAF